MRTSAPGRQRLAAPVLAVLTLLLIASGADRVTAGENQRACMTSEADRWLGALAISIVASEIDPATVDDDYVARETEPIAAKCAAADGQPSAADDAEFRAYIARWSYHLDRKIQEITSKGASD